MANRRLQMFEYRQIIHRMRSGESDRTIARTGLIGRVKAKVIRCIAKINGWLNLENSLPSEQDIANSITLKNNNKKYLSKIEPFTGQIDEWNKQGGSAKVIHQALTEQYNFTGSYHSVLRYLNKINKNKGLTNITVPLYFAPGEAVQIDFGKGPKIFDPEHGKEIGSWFFVMTLCFSRHQYAEIIKHQDCMTWLGCHRRAFEWFNGIPKKTIIDNAKCAITKACFYEPAVQRSYGQQAEDYGFIISACPPYDPEKKGIVESGVKYVKINFLPLRKFKNFQDANEQLKAWVLEIAGNRIHGTTKQKPLSHFYEVEQTLLQPLPAIMPELCTWVKTTCYRDCCIRFEDCRYSVPYLFAKQELWLKVTESTVKIYHDYKLIAIHCRSYIRGSTITLTEHFPPEAKNYLLHDKEWCIGEANLVGPNCLQIVECLLSDKKCDYLRAAQGMIKLKKSFGKNRLELACKRALEFGSANYKTVKEILSKGLEGLSSTELARNKLGRAYLGAGKFCRKAKDFFVH